MIDTALRQAAQWLTRQPYQADPTHWVEQATSRYNLNEQQTAILLHNASR